MTSAQRDSRQRSIPEHLAEQIKSAIEAEDYDEARDLVEALLPWLERRETQP